MYYSVKDFLSESVINKDKYIEPTEKFINIFGKEQEVSSFENKGYIKKREKKLMRKLYSDVSTFLYPFIIEVLDEFDFIGSPIYGINGIDRETLHQLIDRVIQLAEQHLDEIGEIKNEISSLYLEIWSRKKLLRGIVELLLLNDIFGIRRPDYYENYAPTIF